VRATGSRLDDSPLVDPTPQANLYEMVIDVYKFVVDIHQKERDYGQLGECFRDLKVVCETLVKSVPFSGHGVCRVACRAELFAL
jgi:hypothetical protein